MHWQLLRAGKLDAVCRNTAHGGELGKELASIVVEVRPASTSLRKMRRPRSPGTVRAGTSPKAVSFISSAHSEQFSAVPKIGRQLYEYEQNCHGKNVDVMAGMKMAQ